MANSKTNISSVIAMLGVFLLLILFSLQWYFLDSNLRDYKEEKEKELQTIENLRRDALIEFEIIKENDSTIQLRIDDIATINRRYDDLMTFVENNTNRAESLIDKDLDRLNLYLALGIGFVGVLGVFVPILVNIMSQNDLHEKLRSIEEKANSIDIQKINKAAEDANLALKAAVGISTLKKKVDEITKYYQQTGPAVTSLILQNAIGRFFNISPHLITRLKREKDRQYFIKLLETIRNGFDHCKNDNNHAIRENNFLKETIMDFRIYISDQTFQSTVFTEKVVRKFGELSEELGKLLKSTSNEQENENIDKVKVVLDELINDLNLI